MKPILPLAVLFLLFCAGSGVVLLRRRETAPSLPQAGKELAPLRVRETSEEPSVPPAAKTHPRETQPAPVPPSPAPRTSDLRELAQHSRRQWKDYYAAENEGRIRELQELLSLREVQSPRIRDAFTCERDAFDDLWSMLAEFHENDDVCWIETADYRSRIERITSATDAAVLECLDPAQRERYAAWRPLYNEGRYFWTEK